MYQVENLCMVGNHRLVWYPSEFVEIYNNGNYDGHSLKSFRFDTIEDARNEIRKRIAQLPKLNYRILDLETNQVILTSANMKD